MKVLKGLNGTIKELDGTESKNDQGEPLLFKKILGNLIARSTKGEPIRMDKISRDIYFCNGDITLEDADFNSIKSILQDASKATIIKAPLTEVINNVEEVKVD